MKYPEMNDVEAASQQELLKWDRNLPAPRTRGERAVAQRIAQRFLKGGATIGAAKESLRESGFGDLLRGL